MKTDPKIIDLLNEVLTGELTAINQYFLHGRMCKNWGYARLGEKIHKESMLNRGIKHCRDLGDNGTEDLLTKILVSEESHVDWLEQQLQLGEAHYLAQQIRE